jgi:hypothetical protein
MSRPPAFGLAAINLADERCRPHLGAKGNWFNHKFDTIWIGDTQPGYGKVATHELDHFLLHAFTPFGLFLDELAIVQRSLTGHYCEAVHNDLKDVIRNPAYGFAASFNNGSAPPGISREEYASVFRRIMRPWSKAVFLEDVMEGNNFESVRQATIQAAKEALGVCENMCAATFPDAAMFGNKTPHEIPGQQFHPLVKTQGKDENSRPACPDHGNEGDPQNYPVGAANVFEGHAFYNEMHQDGPNPETLKLAAFGDPALRYMGLFAGTVMAYGRQRVNSEEDYLVLTRTFLALCDLALFTPVGAIYARLRPKGYTWEDVHPGYRFLKALAVVEVSGKWLKGSSHGEYEAFQNYICEVVDWVEPSEFTELGMHLTGKDFVRHQKACAIRNQFPNPFADEIHGSQHHKDLLMTGGAFLYAPSTHNQLRLLAPDTQTALSKVIEYFLRNYCWQVMTGRSFQLRDCLPQRLDYLAHFSNIKTADDFLELLGQVEALSYVFDAKLQPLATQ